MFVNDQGSLILRKFTRSQEFSGINIRDAELYSKELHSAVDTSDSSERYGFEPQDILATAKLLDSAISEAKASGHKSVAVVSKEWNTLSNVKDIARHELGHQFQDTYPLRDSDIQELNSRLPAGAADNLRMLGYSSDPQTLVEETLARIKSGAHRHELGMSDSRAAQFLSDYFDKISDTHGPEALDDLSSTGKLARSIKNSRSIRDDK
jgi:hypothetical protein